VIPLNEEHPRRSVRDYVSYFHEDRIHDGLGKDTPNRRPVQKKPCPEATVLSKSVYFSQKIKVPSRLEKPVGNAVVDGVFELGEGAYRLDWLMRDGADRFCAKQWDINATLQPKDRPMNVALPPGTIRAPPAQAAVPRHAGIEKEGAEKYRVKQRNARSEWNVKCSRNREV
jgi:hypothetical protein